MGMKKTLTDSEFAEYIKSGGARQNALSTDGPERSGGVGAYNEFWNTRDFVKDNRTGLIEDEWTISAADTRGAEDTAGLLCL